MGNFERPPMRLEQLQKIEEAHRLALDEAIRSRATPTVVEDLQTQYLLAKQEREDFEQGMSW